MRWYFEPLHHPDQAEYGDEAAGEQPAGVPAGVLRRHGARVLSPDDQADDSGASGPRSTVYRARTLLLPADLAHLGEAINRALGPSGLRLVSPGPGTADGLPQTAVLVPAGDDHGGDVDAAAALRVLRAAARSGAHDLSEEAVSRISLEHVLAGSAITGMPASEGGGISGNPASEGGGVSGRIAASSYMFSGDARLPVDVCLDAPARRSLEECAARLGRRPVVAVLDTGVRDHPWLDVFADPSSPGGFTTVPDGFVAVDLDIQAAIYARGLAARAAGDRHRSLIRYPWDGPVVSDPLIGELDAFTGHGHFIAGIVRQAVPDAQVLAIRIMHSDGVVYEGDLMCALHMLAHRVAGAIDGDMTQMVDVLSLSLGYFSETEADARFTSRLWQVLDDLTGMGVAVTAAAGNFATRRMLFPAALAGRPLQAGHAPLISVGALNPNGTKALFSDEGPWVRAWATGAGLVSTFPVVNGSRTAPVSVPGGRSALDPDDYGSGFAIWAGTSFSAPVIAAQIAREIAAGAGADRQLRLDGLGADTAVNRVSRALKHLGWQG